MLFIRAITLCFQFAHCLDKIKNLISELIRSTVTIQVPLPPPVWFDRRVPRHSDWLIFVKPAFSSSKVLVQELCARWGSFDGKFSLTRSGIKGDIISLYWNEFDSVSSLVAQSKQTQQAFGLAYWCPVGVGLWAKMKICTVWFRGKMSSTLPLFPPALRFFQRSVFVPCSLVSLCSPSPGLWEERVGDGYMDLSVWICVTVCGNMCMLEVR